VPPIHDANDVDIKQVTNSIHEANVNDKEASHEANDELTKYSKFDKL